VRDSGDVPSWPSKIGNKPGANRVGHRYKYDRDRGGRRLGGKASRHSDRQQDVWFEADQFLSQRREAFELALGESGLDDQVPSLDISEVTHSLPKGSAPAEAGAGPALQIADPVHLPRLLRLAGERRGQGTGQRGQQEAAAVHYSMT
jgi:hypothetical protein